MKKTSLSLVLCLSMVFTLSAVDAYAAREDWSEAFYDFLFAGGYWESAQRYTIPTGGVPFGLHDLDGDGVPELIAFNGSNVTADMTNYVYAYRNGKVTYLGDIGFRGYGFTYAPGSGYPGLFYQNGKADYWPGYYYSVENGRLKEELVLVGGQVPLDGKVGWSETQETSDDTLYKLFSNSADSRLAELFMPGTDEIWAMGWDTFVAQSISRDNTFLPT